MQKRTERRLKADKLVDADGRHLYRVVVERTMSKVALIRAESRKAAEYEAYALASRNRSPLQWIEGVMQVKDCTSVKLTDGSWRLANEIEKEK